jgi:hypothetical protein
MQSMTDPRHVAIRSEFDIVNLRHTVRQMARTVGLDLTRQAKVTVAISALARAFLKDDGNVLFVVQVASGTPSALEISCISSDTYNAQNADHLENMLNLNEVRLLVDEFEVTLINATAHLTMRVWLAA